MNESDNDSVEVVQEIQEEEVKIDLKVAQEDLS